MLMHTYNEVLLNFLDANLLTGFFLFCHFLVDPEYRLKIYVKHQNQSQL